MKDSQFKYLEILEKLIAFKSITPKGKDAFDYVSSLLKPHGFEVILQNFGTGESETWNLYAFRGEVKPNICFAGHVDVVPPGNLDGWDADPFSLTQKGDFLYGRGVVDMKGAIASALAAVLELIDKYPDHKGSISFLLTTDEEGTGEFGTKMMLEHISGKYKAIDFCILGEPTSENKVGDMMKIGRRGSISFDLTINGTQGHVAYPNLADNPLPILVNILKELEDHQLDEGSQFFDPSNLEITTIDTGNDVTNIIPAKCSAKFNIRFNDHHNVASLLQLVQSIIVKYTPNYELKHSCSSLPFIQEYSDNMRNFAKIIEKECKLKPVISTSGGTSDARFIHNYAEIVEFGLNSNKAHQINEYCQIYDLQMLCNVYYAYLVGSLCL